MKNQIQKGRFSKEFEAQKGRFSKYGVLVIWRDFVWSFGGDPQDAQRINNKTN